MWERGGKHVNRLGRGPLKEMRLQMLWDIAMWVLQYMDIHFVVVHGERVLHGTFNKPTDKGQSIQ